MVEFPREHWPKPTEARPASDVRGEFNEIMAVVTADIFPLEEDRYHLDRPTFPPRCSHTVTTRYWGEDGYPLAITHHYLFPDGTTTKPDPKWLRVGDQIWKPIG